MKLLTYEIDGKERIGVLNDEETWVYPASAAEIEYRNMKEFIREAGESEMEMLDCIRRRPPYEVPGAAPIGDIKILAPIPVPDQDVICLGINYAAHAEESARFKKEAFRKDTERQAVYFSKRVNRAVDPEGGISAHRDLTSQLDYEAGNKMTLFAAIQLCMTSARAKYRQAISNGISERASITLRRSVRGSPRWTPFRFRRSRRSGPESTESFGRIPTRSCS